MKRLLFVVIVLLGILLLIPQTAEAAEEESVMRVHVVCHQIHKDRVLPRLTRMLAEGSGWAIGERADHTADINYFLPYLTYEADCPTRTAAWFTHYDTQNPEKAAKWDRVAAAVDIRTTSAPMYADMLRQHGETQLVTPPIDTQFQVNRRTVPGTVMLGVSGYVYNDGRKGEDLIGRLLEDGLPDGAEIRASGRGWPVEDLRGHAWRDMHRYYQSVDILIVPSRIEGIPMPPLEALACGTRVVIPTGVGLLDELPDIPGIYRFEAGDYQSMRQAVVTAVQDEREIAPESLRAVVREYTPIAWCESHLMALGDRVKLSPVTASGPIPENCGVYYVAYGEPARRCAQVAIESWKEHMPSVPVALASDRPLGPEDIFIEHPDVDVGGRITKLKVYDLAPPEWDYVLYLDADTEIVADVRYLFQLVADGWDMAICKDSGQYASATAMVRPDNKPEVEATWEMMGSRHTMQFNGGVFVFQRNERTRAFFEAWQAEWDRWGMRDQAALLRAMWSNPLRLFVLGSQWNLVPKHSAGIEAAGIIHYPMRARRWEGLLPRLDSTEAWEKVTR